MRRFHLQKKDILGSVVAKSGQECGLWFLNLRNKLKRICLKVAGPMTPGRSGFYICTFEMSPVKFQHCLFSLLSFKDAEHQKSCSCLSCLQAGAITRCPLLRCLPDHHTPSLVFGSFILLLSLSLHCKRCRKQMCDKISKSLSDCFSLQ